jgi:two-component system CheB/CheR fusion protein
MLVDEGKVIGAVMTLVDSTERQRRQKEVWRQANFDHLTGLANRSLFADRLERALLLQARTGGRAAVLFIDLDGFKPVNDRFGHAAGDAVLIEIAQRLQAITRESDIAARFGGDEFVLGLTELAADLHVEQVVRKVLDAIEMPCNVGDNPILLSASIGIAMFPSDSDRTETLLLMADEAMYRAKAAGKRRFCYFARGSFRNTQ